MSLPPITDLIPKIKQDMKAYRVTQRALAEAAGLPTSTINNLLTGYRSGTYVVLYKVTKALDELIARNREKVHEIVTK